MFDDSSRFRRAAVRVATIAVLVMAVSTAAFQDTPQAGALTVAGDVATPLALTMADLKAMPRTIITTQDAAGAQVTHEGVLVSEILARAGVPIGRTLTGNALTTYVRASASDGYEVVFSIGELDPGTSGSRIIVADTTDGKPLFDFQGPLRIIVPGDSRGARQIRMLTRLEVVRLRK